MPPPSFQRPDVLVLGAGGMLGEAWMSGLLAGIEDAAAIDLRECEHFVGTSAGAIVAAGLAAGHSPRRPGDDGGEPGEARDEPSAQGGRVTRIVRAAGRVSLAATYPLADLALAIGAPAGALARSALLARLPQATGDLEDLRERVERSGARFDGRLRVTAVDRRSGRRVVFGAPGAPAASVGRAVAASCAVPWRLRPVTIGLREYVDGGVWSATNLDAAPAGRDTYVLCLSTLAGLAVPTRSPLGALRAAARAGLALEEMALRARGAIVRSVLPAPRVAAAIGTDLMDGAAAARVHALGYRQGRALAG